MTASLALAQDKAATLIEALPWLARFHGATVVIKPAVDFCSGLAPYFSSSSSTFSIGSASILSANWLCQ